MPAEDVDELALSLELQRQSCHTPVIQELPHLGVVVARGAHDEWNGVVPGDKGSKPENQFEGEGGGTVFNGLQDRFIPEIQGLAHFRQGQPGHFPDIFQGLASG